MFDCFSLILIFLLMLLLNISLYYFIKIEFLQLYWTVFFFKFGHCPRIDFPVPYYYIFYFLFFPDFKKNNLSYFYYWQVYISLVLLFMRCLWYFIKFEHLLLLWAIFPTSGNFSEFQKMLQCTCWIFDRFKSFFFAPGHILTCNELSLFIFFL